MSCKGKFHMKDYLIMIVSNKDLGVWDGVPFLMGLTVNPFHPRLTKVGNVIRLRTNQHVTRHQHVIIILYCSFTLLVVPVIPVVPTKLGKPSPTTKPKGKSCKYDSEPESI